MRSTPKLFGLLLAGLLVACSLPQSTTPPTASTGAPTSVPAAAPSPAAQAAAGLISSPAAAASPASSPVAAVTGSPSPVAASSPSPIASPAGSPVASSGASTAGDTTPKVVAAANAFLATLNDAQRSQAVFEFGDEAAKAQWSNLPRALFKWVGVAMGDLNQQQQQAVHDLLRAALSPSGYDRVIASVNADEYLKSQSGDNPLQFGADSYFVAIFGTPSATASWMFRFGGHHITVNATVAGSNIALTPSFPGCQPCEYTANGQTLRPDGAVVDKSFAFINSLDDAQRQQAVLGSQGIDLVLGPNQPMRNVPPEGLKVSALTSSQQAMLLDLIRQYVGIVNDEDAALKMTEVQSTLADTYFAWYGPITSGSAAYFRIQGPTLWIEHSPQGGGGPGGDGPPAGASAGGTPGTKPSGGPAGAKPSGGQPAGAGLGLGGDPTTNHVHSIYRDPTNEYGAKWAGR
jgi:hypothetical protein